RSPPQWISGDDWHSGKGLRSWDRSVWLPTLLAGRVFTHRLGADEAVHDMLGVTPDLDPITTLCEHEEYGRLADVVAAKDAELQRLAGKLTRD
ncbi:hypothetical protein GR254_08700, partial [Mycobacterium tuberculosis]|nr:hypothetical protein [Mycobacterium tuberculosis]